MSEAQTGQSSAASSTAFSTHGLGFGASQLFLPMVDEIVARALKEDIGSGDITTQACILPGSLARARGIARKAMTVCGVGVAGRAFLLVDPSLRFEACAAEGACVAPGMTLFTVSGEARSILVGERVALNLIQRMCGIATTTRRYVDAIAEGAPTRITDTRKTTPGLRVLERYAVRAGGGHNHRHDLGSAVLIKDNHIVAAGGIREAIVRARRHAPHTSKIECEVDSLSQLDEAIAAGADIVLLDNMSTEQVEQAVRHTQGRVVLEASGGITLERVFELSRAGVDAISVGALTHSTEAADIGLDFEG